MSWRGWIGGRARGRQLQARGCWSRIRGAGARCQVAALRPGRPLPRPRARLITLASRWRSQAAARRWLAARPASGRRASARVLAASTLQQARRPRGCTRRRPSGARRRPPAGPPPSRSAVALAAAEGAPMRARCANVGARMPMQDGGTAAGGREAVAPSGTAAHVCFSARLPLCAPSHAFLSTFVASARLASIASVPHRCIHPTPHQPTRAPLARRGHVFRGWDPRSLTSAPSARSRSAGNRCTMATEPPAQVGSRSHPLTRFVHFSSSPQQPSTHTTPAQVSWVVEEAAPPPHSRETLRRAYLGAVATLSLGVLGSSVLPVPFAISRVGLLMGALTMLVVAWVSLPPPPPLRPRAAALRPRRGPPAPIARCSPRRRPTT
jgi:hypothetical protein